MASNEYKFVKSVSMSELPKEAWQFITGTPAGTGDLAEYQKVIPWLFRGVDIRVNAIENIPFAIFRGDTEIDNSDDYKNAVKFMPNPDRLIGLIEASLTIFGYAYLFRLRNQFMQTGLRYLSPTSIRPEIEVDTAAIVFNRTVGSKTKSYTPEDIVYFWKPDPLVELGPPTISPAKAAANACGVLLNVDNFAKVFFKQGAVKTTLLATENIHPAERERLKSWWKRVLGMERAWQTDIINAGKITPITIGEGIESLSNNDLTETKRIDIAAALGIPYSVMFSNASNRATAEQDDLHLYDKTIIPDARFIQSVLNEQVFEPLGYRFAFNQQEMSLYQADEHERADSLVQLISALQKPEEFLLAAEILGYDINDQVLLKIQNLVTAKQERREEMADKFSGSPTQPEPGKPDQGPEPSPEPDEQKPDNLKAIDLDKWKVKAIKRVKAGRPALCPFESDYIDPVTRGAIRGALETATTEDEVKEIFADIWVGYP